MPKKVLVADILVSVLIFAVGIVSGRFLIPEDTPLLFGGTNNIEGAPKLADYTWSALDESRLYLPEDSNPQWEVGDPQAEKKISILLDPHCDYGRLYAQEVLPLAIREPDTYTRVYLMSYDKPSEADLGVASTFQCVAKKSPPQKTLEFLTRYTDLQVEDAAAAARLALEMELFESQAELEDCTQANQDEVALDFNIFQSIGVDTAPMTILGERSFEGYIPAAYFRRLLRTWTPGPSSP